MGPRIIYLSSSSSFAILFIVKLRCDIIALSSPGNMSAGRAAVSLHTGASFSGHLVSVEPDVTCRYLLLNSSPASCCGCGDAAFMQTGKRDLKEASLAKLSLIQDW